METKCQAISWPWGVENWHDGGFQDPTVDFCPLYKLTTGKLGSFESAQGIIEDNLFWVKSCRFEGRDYEAREL